MNLALIVAQLLAFSIVLLPLLIVAVVLRTRGLPVSLFVLGLATGVFALHAVVLALPHLPWFDGLRFNWQNKVLVSILVTLALMQCPQDFRTRAGFSLPAGPWLVYTAVATVVILILAVGAGLSIGDPQEINAETLMFQATVPGFDEELIYRGVLFALFGLAFGLRTRNGLWSIVLLTTILFGLAHGVAWRADSLVFLSGPCLTACAIGFWLGWVRLYTGSILPAIALHNTYNVVFNLTASF